MCLWQSSMSSITAILMDKCQVSTNSCATLISLLNSSSGEQAAYGNGDLTVIAANAEDGCPYC